MPLYEYEPDERDCLICHGRFEVLQSVSEAAYSECPFCGMACRRVVSRAALKLKINTDADHAAKKGLTTWRKSGEGRWEKVAGPGVDVIQGTPEDVQAVKAEKRKPKVHKLDGS